MKKRSISKDSYVDSPVAWFVMLERARLDNDFEAAAKAKQELERLGVTVKYRRLQRKEK